MQSAFAIEETVFLCYPVTMQPFSIRMSRLGPWIERIWVSCFAGFLATLWGGLLLAEVGRFTAWPAILAGAMTFALVWRHGRRHLPKSDTAPALTAGFLAAAALGLVVLVCTLPPSEWVLGGWDPGVYVHTAGSLARTGTLHTAEPDLAGMDEAARSLFGRQYNDVWEPFLGMRMLPNGKISPQFYHLYPVLMATAWPFGGMHAAVMVNPLLNVACVILMYLWASQWLRPRWAFAAALVMALNPAQVWQARFCTSELLTQCLLLGGLAMMGRALSGRPRNLLDAVLAGSAFGLAMLTRYDTVLFVVPLSLVLLFGCGNRSLRTPVLVLLGVLVALSMQVWLHQRFLAPLYHPGSALVILGLKAAGIVAVMMGVALFLSARHAGRGDEKTPQWMRWLPMVCLALFAAWVFFCWYIRPRLTVEGRVLSILTGLYPGLKEAAWFPLMAGRNARNAWYLQNLFGVPGLLAALAGTGILIFRSRTVWRAAAVSAGLTVLVLLMTMIYHEPFMMFVSRRLIPVIIPLLCLGVAAACDSLESRFASRKRIGLALAGILLAATLAVPLKGAAFMAGNREWPGLISWYNQLAAAIPPRARVYSDQPGFAAPLRFLYGLRAYEIRALPPDPQSALMIMMLNQSGEGPVLWLTQNAIPEAQRGQVVQVLDLPLRSSILGSTAHDVPHFVRQRGGRFRLYGVLPVAGPAAAETAGAGSRAMKTTD